MSRELGIVEDTLYVPMLGRIYASENCRNILYDEKALELKSKLPKGLIENDTQTQYTYVDSAARLASGIGGTVKVLAEENFYNHTDKVGLQFSTKFSMVVSDWFSMVKMIHLCL